LPATLGPAHADKARIKAKANEKTAQSRVAQHTDRFSEHQTFAPEEFLTEMAAGSTKDATRIEPPYSTQFDNDKTIERDENIVA
jgi:hypothetical protein